MIDRACISINNKCNLSCAYCHFHEPEKTEYLTEKKMDVYSILDNITYHIEKHNIRLFKLGFVGNGEPLLSFSELSGYIQYIKDYLLSGRIAAYTITNGIPVTDEMLEFFRKYNVNVGFSLDGVPDIHNKYRCGSYNAVINAIEKYRTINGCYPSMNCTVSQDVLERGEETITFFEKYGSRITFSRMIGKNGVTLSEFHQFLDKAEKRLNVRRGGYDCTMYGGLCGAGINNIFYANGNIYICGNCVDLPAINDANAQLDDIAFDIKQFDRMHCFREERFF